MADEKEKKPSSTQQGEEDEIDVNAEIKKVPTIDGDKSIIEKTSVTATTKEFQNKRNLDGAKRADKANREENEQDDDEEGLSPDERAANKARKGAPHKVSQGVAGASVQGNEGGQQPGPEGGQANQQTLANQQGQEAQNQGQEQQPGDNKQPEPQSGGQPDQQAPEKQRSQTRADFTKQRMEEQRKKISETLKKREGTKKEHDKNVEQKSWKRVLSNRKLKKQEKDLKKQKKTLDKLGKVLGTQTGTGHVLKLAWLNLIDSFGITWFYIAIHFLAAYFTPFSNLFCKFGEEWIPKKIQQLPSKLPGPGEKASQATKKVNKGLELIESCACFLIGFLWLGVILLIFLIIGVIGYIATYPLDSFMAIGKLAWDIVKSYVAGIFTGG